jgi:DNA-directed RNA polymerase subunit RPC12/RpoP
MATYLFGWDNLSTNAEARFKDFLIKKYRINWVNNAKLEKIDDGKTIQLADEENSLFLVLNDNRTEATLIICDGIIDKLKAVDENGELNIYNDTLCPKCGKDFLEDLENELRCKNCGFSLGKTRPLEAKEAFKTLIAIFGGIIFYITPLLVIYGIIIIIFYYILVDIHIILFVKPDRFLEPETLAKMILYLTVSMGLMDLASLISNQYLRRSLEIILELAEKLTSRQVSSNYCKQEIQLSTPEEKDNLQAEKIYISKVLTFTTVFILSHILYVLFKNEQISRDLSYFVIAGMLGSSAVLISIGLWNKFFLGTNRR